MQKILLALLLVAAASPAMAQQVPMEHKELLALPALQVRRAQLEPMGWLAQPDRPAQRVRRVQPVRLANLA